MAIAVTIIAATTIRIQNAQAFFKDEAVDLWLGGDVNLGDGGHKQLSGIAGIVQGAIGIVNLEGPVAERSELRKAGLRLWNAPASPAAPGTVPSAAR